MIYVNNKFINSNLEVKFTKETQIINEINIPVANDVNFKELIDYLLEIIPDNDNLEIEFENFDTQEEFEKLELIKDTVTEIYEKFNASILSESDENLTKEVEIEETGDQGDDLPF